MKLKVKFFFYVVENWENVKKKRKIVEILFLIKYGVKIVDYMNLNFYRIWFYIWFFLIFLKIVYCKILIISFVIFIGKYVNGLKIY